MKIAQMFEQINTDWYIEIKNASVKIFYIFQELSVLYSIVPWNINQ